MRLISEAFERQIVHQPLLIKEDRRRGAAAGHALNPITGLLMLLVSICPPAPTAMMAIDPSMPTFEPSVRCWQVPPQS
jgi:hypothetical protein